MPDVTEQFEMTVVHAGPDTPILLHLSGELDFHAARIVGERVDDLRAIEADAIHIDTADVTFVDSSGLHALLEVKRHADLEGLGFRVVGVCVPLRDLVDMTGTAGMLPGT